MTEKKSLNLSALIGSENAELLRTQYWQHRFAVFSVPDEITHSIFPIESISEMLRFEPNRFPDVTLFNNKAQVAKGLYTRSPFIDHGEVYSSIDPHAMLNQLEVGSTAVFLNAQRHAQGLAQLCRDLGSEIGQPFTSNAYLTPPASRAFAPHWDPHETFILQVAGSKLWHVRQERGALHPVVPSQSLPYSPDETGWEHFVLPENSLLYLPRGFVHCAETLDEASFHLTLSARGASKGQILIEALSKLTGRDSELGEYLPFGWHNSEKDTDRFTAELIADLSNLLAEPSTLKKQIRHVLNARRPVDGVDWKRYVAQLFPSS